MSKKSNSVNQDYDLSSNQNVFSKIQKDAILFFLLMIINAKKESDSKSLEYLNIINEILGIELRTFQSYSDQFKEKKDRIDVFKGITMEQKVWIITVLHSMTISNGIPNKDALEKAIGLCLSIGISKDIYTETVQKEMARQIETGEFEILSDNKSKSIKADNELSYFQNSFNNKQKDAIITALTIVSNSKGGPHPKDLEELIETATILGIDLNAPGHSTDLFKSDQDLIVTLKTLDQLQKSWFIIVLHSMALAKGTATQAELAAAVNICNRIGISDDVYVETVKKSAAIKNRIFG